MIIIFEYSGVMAVKMLLSCTNPSMLCMGKGLVPDGQQASVYIHDDLMCTHEISHVSSIEMGVCDTSVIWELIYLDGLMGDCSVSSAFTLEILQSCTKASI